MNFENPRDIELEIWENGFNLDYHKYVRDASPIHINIPKLMPFIPIAPSKDTIRQVNTAMIQNDVTCRPRVTGNLVSCNYIISPRNSSQSYNGEVGLGNRLNCFIGNRNPKRIEYTTV